MNEYIAELQARRRAMPAPTLQEMSDEALVRLRAFLPTLPIQSDWPEAHAKAIDAELARRESGVLDAGTRDP